MRYLIVLFITTFIFGCATSKNKSKNKFILNGSWTPIKQEMGGKEFPATYYKSQTLVLQDSTYTLTGEGFDRGSLIYKNGKMDIYGKEGPNNGNHITAIYKLENDVLTIVYNLKGDNYPTAFDSKLSPLFFLSVFKRANSK